MTLEELMALGTRVGTCLEWQGHTQKRGTPIYSRMIDGKRVHFSVRRRVAELSGIDIAGANTTTSCRNPRCIEPSHIITMGMAEQVARYHAEGRVDKEAKRKACAAAAQARSKISRHHVALIKAGLMDAATAKACGIKYPNYRRIVTGAAWADVAPYTPVTLPIQPGRYEATGNYERVITRDWLQTRGQA